MTSIIILSYNTLTMTQMCVESIRGFTEPGTYEIIVVDNASKDGSVEWLKEQSDIRCIFNEQNEGFPKGCNQGMEIAIGNDILLLNSDTIVTPCWLENLRIALYSDKMIGAVGCVTNNCSNLQKVSVNYTDPLDAIKLGEYYNHSDNSKWKEMFKLVAFCMLIKREVYEKIGCFDERFTPGNYEDDDYSLRISLAGYKLLLCEDTFIHHFRSASFINKYHNEDERKTYNSLVINNEKMFCDKWYVDSSFNIICEKTLEFIKKLNDGERILYVGNSSMIDLITLHRFNKFLQLEYITCNYLDWKTPQNFIRQYNVTDIEKECTQLLSGIYDWIVIDSGISKKEYVSNVYNILLRYVSQHGRVYVDNV